MAISKILHMQDCGKAFHGKHLKAALSYITVPEKTQNGRLVSAVNCQTASAFEQMEETKERFGKKDKRQAYHLILSFQENEADPDTVFKLTQQFVAEYLGGDYEAVFAVHDNTKHPHSHIIFNSVSFRDGRKYHYKRGDWERHIQPLTNRLCAEYGLSVLELEEGTEEREQVLHDEGVQGGQHAPYRKRGGWTDMVRRDVDACILLADSFEAFLTMLQGKGYELKNAHGEGKYLSVKPPGAQRMIRLKTLGEDYAEERIRQRIAEETVSAAPLQEEKEAPKMVSCKIKRYRRAKLTGLQKKYFARLYRTGKLKKKPYSEAWKYKDEIKQMHRLQTQYLFLVRHGIHTVEQLFLVAESLTDKKREVDAQKRRLYRADRKNSELYEKAAQMEELIPCEHAYQAGDTFFQEEHLRYESFEKELAQMGYTYDEVKTIERHYREELKRYRELSYAVSEEAKLADSICAEYTAGMQAVKKNEPEPDRQEPEKKEEQPRR